MSKGVRIAGDGEKKLLRQWWSNGECLHYIIRALGVARTMDFP